MSRSGYTDDCDAWAMIRWRGAVSSATRGKRGQAFFAELLVALDAMPSKRLIAEELQTVDGCMCTLGVLGLARGLDMTVLDPEDTDRVGAVFGIPRSLAAEIVYMNDDDARWQYSRGEPETPEARWIRMRAWVSEQIKLPSAS